MRVAGLKSYPITFGEFAVAFVPFAILLGAALLGAETSMNLVRYRTTYTVWAMTALVIPAYVAFILPGSSTQQRNLWLLYWTFSFLIYAVHTGYAVFGVYHGNVREFLVGQGWFAAVNNVIFTLWWLLDVGLAWFREESRGIRVQRVAAHWYIGLTFFASTVILNRGFVNVIGGVFTAVVSICLMARFDMRRHPVPAPR